MDNQSGATMECCFDDMGAKYRWPLLIFVPVAVQGVMAIRGPEKAELAALRRGVQRGSPYGEGAWCDQIVRRLGLESTLHPQGRPKKRENGS
jgi:hypothetical protein